MTSSVRAAPVVLLMGVSTAADGAYNSFVPSAAVASCVVQRPAALALLDKGAGDELTDAGLTPEHEGRVAGHVLETRPVLIEESERNRTKMVLRVPGRQPVRFPEDNEVFHDLVA